jgi:hypothetical protein
MAGLSDAWGSFTNFLGIGLEDQVGNNRASRPADVTRVQRVMQGIGYYPDDRPANGILDRELDTGLRRFQNDQGLRVDGWMRPDGPTHERLRSELGANLRAGAVVRRRSDAVSRPEEEQAESSVWTRLGGALQVLGGGAEIGVGAAGAALPTPLTAGAGLVLMGHGADNVATGARKVWTGRALPTVTARALENVAQALGADERTASRMAEATDTALSAVGSVGAASAARAAGYGVRFLRYPNVGGFGINLEKNGKRFFTADVHRFTHKGVEAVRPHYHRGSTNSQLRKHRPWEGGW